MYNSSDKSEVEDWYADQHILITGASGFMGKVLIEKLLRSCPKIAAIYLLIRSKKGKDCNERLEDVLKLPLFKRLREEPNADDLFKKLHAINGDVTLPECMISAQDLNVLRDNVTVVFHMAANVRFDQSLKAAVSFNVGGTKNVLDLACTMKNLKAFVHVSTSYCHCDETRLKERIYPAPHNPRNILDLVQWMSPEILEKITPMLIKNSPNTYAYTKCLTEELVNEYSSSIPIAIARPSIVSASWKEPIPGWVDNLNGPTGIIVGAGKGVIRSMHCNADLIANIVPVDVCINSLILIGWKRGNDTQLVSDVYHVVADEETSWTWGQLLENGKKHFFNHPFRQCLWYPGGSIKSNYYIHMIAVLLFHIIPAYLVDFALYIIGRAPFLVRAQDRVQSGLKVLQYYTTRPWFFHYDKLNRIYDKLGSSDQAKFFTNDMPIDYDQYMFHYVLGAREYCVGDSPDTVASARKNLRRLYYLDMLKNVLIVAFILWMVYSALVEDSIYSYGRVVT